MEAIHAASSCLKLAITLHDDRAPNKCGRVFLDDFCGRNCVPLLKISHINEDTVITEVRKRQIDWLFIVGWSQIAGPALLQAPRLGVLGIHPTLLPEGRGRASIPWAILKRLPRTGVTLFKLTGGVDTGPIVAQQEIALPTNADASWLYEKVNVAHVALIREVLPKLNAGELTPLPQSELEASVWPGRKPEDGRIDLAGSVRDAECLVRAVTRPYPGAFFEFEGKRIVVWKARITERSRDGFFLDFKDGVLQCLDYESVRL